MGDEEDEELEEYEYCAEGTATCALCESMVGVYEYEPQQPHDYCDCDITPTSAKTSNYSWDYKIIDTDWGTTPAGEEYIARVEVEVYVTCNEDGSNHEDSFIDEQDVHESNYEESDLPDQAAGFASWMYENYCVGIV
jgi:hypothetical protein